VTIRSCAGTFANAYRFRCPLCSSWIVREADLSVVALLSRAGALFDGWRGPLEMNEHPDPSVAPISHDDLIDFHEALEGLPTAVRDSPRKLSRP
jgi:hypothetical protein